MRQLVSAIIVLTAVLVGLRWLLQAEPVPGNAGTAAAAVAEMAPNSTLQARQVGHLAQTPTGGSGPGRGGGYGLPRQPVDLAHVHEVPFDDGRFAALAVGDQLRIEFPPLGGRYDLEVVAVEETASGRTIRGRIEYDARTYPGLITSSGGWSFGTLMTPEGSIEFAARGGLLRTVDGEELDRRARIADHTLVPPRS